MLWFLFMHFVHGDSGWLLYDQHFWQQAVSGSETSWSKINKTRLSVLYAHSARATIILCLYVPQEVESSQKPLCHCHFTSSQENAHSKQTTSVKILTRLSVWQTPVSMSTSAWGASKGKEKLGWWHDVTYQGQWGSSERSKSEICSIGHCYTLHIISTPLLADQPLNMPMQMQWAGSLSLDGISYLPSIWRHVKISLVIFTQPLKERNAFTCIVNMVQMIAIILELIYKVSKGL